jgi:two-component system chemotaxis response regulator CheB
MAGIRVIVVDDSPVARTVLRAHLESDPGIRVVAEAGDGREAVELVHRHLPDLVTMDLAMPVMGGLEAIEEIMATRAVPILVISGVADSQAACEAVARGALEVIDKPEPDPAARAAFLARVRILAGVRVITHLRVRRAPRPEARTAAPGDPISTGPICTGPIAAGPAAEWPRLFAIASSTGGPQVLASLLPQLPAGFPCPVVIAQHIAEGFAAGLAEWLAGLCEIRVRLARDGEPLRPGTAYVSPAESHLAVGADKSLLLLPRAPGDLYRPSCDVLLKSVAASCGARGVGIILTGMGSDGAAGLGQLRRAGGITLAQDEASSVVFGMNRVAIESGAVQQVLPAERIGPQMLMLAGCLAVGGEKPR